MLNKKVKLFGLLFLLGIGTASAQLEFKVGNGEDKLKITPMGRFYFDGATYVQDDTSLGNGVTMSDLRLGLKASYKEWSMKADVGFAKGKVSAKDIFLQYNFKKSSYLRLGHFAEPFGLDHMESSANVKFMTANASSLAFSPGRKVGLEYVGWNKYLWYAGGVFADGDAIKNEKKGDDGFGTTARLVFTPFKEPGKILHIGAAGSFRKADKVGYNDSRIKSISYATSLLTNVESMKPLGASIASANYQAKYAIELIGAYGPVSIQSEYFHTNVKRYYGLDTYQAKGAYGQVAVLALGGNYGYSDAWGRLAPPKGGALEFVARYNYTDLSDRHSGIAGGSMRDISAAANYYLNKFVVFRLNYSYMNMGKSNANLADEAVHAIQARVQVVF